MGYGGEREKERRGEGGRQKLPLREGDEKEGIQAASRKEDLTASTDRQGRRGLSLKETGQTITPQMGTLELQTLSCKGSVV